MRPDERDRRKFLTAATAGLAGGALVALPGKSFAAETPTAASPIYQVQAFGALGDGKALDSPAIDKAIAAAAAAGGGTVFFPAGTFRCYSVHLQSNVALYLAPGSILLASDPPEEGSAGYDLPESNAPWEAYQDFGHNHWHNSLLWGENLHNVSISGPGLDLGQRPESRMGRWPESRTAGRRQQSDRAQELPQRPAARLFHSSRRPLRHSRHRRRQPHHRQSHHRHQPRRHGHRLLPQRPRVELQRQFAVGRRHLPEEFIRARLRSRHRNGHHQQLPM